MSLTQVVQVQVQTATHLLLGPCDRAAHDQAVPPDAPVPAGPYAVDLHVLKARCLEPLHERHAAESDVAAADCAVWSTPAMCSLCAACIASRKQADRPPHQAQSGSPDTHSTAWCCVGHLEQALCSHAEQARTVRYSSSVGNSIQQSAKKRDSQKVGCTGPMRQARPPGLVTLYASLMPRCGSGQYSMLPADT